MNNPDLRFRYPGHLYPQLCQEGLGHIWVGPKRNDFAAPIVLAVRKHLEKHDLPSGRGDAINCIRNKILVGDYGWLEQRDEEGQVISFSASKPKPEPLAASVPEQPRQLTQADHLARLKALWTVASMRDHLRRQVAENPEWGIVIGSDGPEVKA